MAKAKIILMDIPWDYEFGRQVQRGICRFAGSNRPWTFARLWSYADIKQWLKRSDTAGIISMHRPEKYVPVARRYGLAAVGVGGWASEHKYHSLPYVDVNPKALGEMAADYFIDRGFGNFGMIATDKLPHSQYRGEAFVAALRRRKLTCGVFDIKKRYPPCGKPIHAVTYNDEKVRRWLSGLDKPLAVFAIDDYTALWVCEVCSHIGVRVPEEVAVLGVDNDDMFCELTHPRLSSIRVPAEQIGFEAARLLNAMLHNKRVPKRPVLLPPAGVVTRQSTDIMVSDDPYVVKAMHFICEHAYRGIRVKNVMAEVHLSRRPLERRFQKAIGRSPFEEIRRIQIEKAKTLLSQTDMTLETIVPECGFGSVKLMSLAFKRTAGVTPGAWRKRFRNTK